MPSHIWNSSASRSARRANAAPATRNKPAAATSATTSAECRLRSRSSASESGRSVSAPGSWKMLATTESSTNAPSAQPTVTRIALRLSRTAVRGDSAAAASSAPAIIPAPVVLQIVNSPHVSVKIEVSTEKNRFLVASTRTPASASRSSSVPLRAIRPASSAATSRSTSADTVSLVVCSARFW